MHDLGPKDRLLVGVKQTSRAISDGSALKVFVARDAEQHVTRRVLELAGEYRIEVVFIESMKELGKACKIDVGAATAVLLK